MTNNSLNLTASPGEGLRDKQKILFAHKAYWFGQLLFFSTYIGVGILMSLIYTEKLSPAAITISTLLGLLLIFATHGFRYCYKIKIHNWTLLKTALLLLWFLPLLSVFIQALMFCILTFLYSNFTHLVAGMMQYNWGSYISYVIQTIAITFVWVATYLMISQYRSKRETELAFWQSQARLRETELQFLHNQINSHFLFNAMNNVRALIREDPEQARDRLTQLSSLLRAVLQAGIKEKISVSEELSLTDSYLDLESLQLEDRLRIEKNIDENILKNMIPPLLLQTIVENAISHGVSRMPEGGCIKISIQKENDKFEVRVINPIPLGTKRAPQINDVGAELESVNGQEEPLYSSSGYGIGLDNVRKRLKAIYHDSASLRLLSEANTMTAILSIPL